MFLRRLLLQLLLLAMFFNTAIGLPLHEAGHMQQALGGLSSVAQTADTHRAEPTDGTDGQDEAHGLCAWCLAFAHPTQVPALGLALPALWAPEALAPRPAAVAFVPGPERWRFASRDPPHTFA